MKKLLLAILMIAGIKTNLNAQIHTNKDGSPDMRYKENKQIYGNNFELPDNNFELPNNNFNSYSTPSTPNYNLPNQQKNSYPSYPSYPNKQDGTPDMRFKDNRQLYGRP